MSLILEADDFADTIFYVESDTPGENIGFHRAFRKRPALAMIAAKVHDMATAYLPIPTEHLCVVMHNRPEFVAFQLMLHNDPTPEGAFAFNELLNMLEDTARDHDLIRINEETHGFAADTEQPLLDLIVDFADRHGFDFNGREIDKHHKGNIEKFHANNRFRDAPTWEASAEKALMKPWVMAALPVKIYTEREELLRDAYRIRQIGIYTEEEIQTAIDAGGATHAAPKWVIAYN